MTSEYSEIPNMYIIVTKNQHIDVPIASSHGYAQVTFKDIAPAGYKLLGDIGFFLSVGYIHRYGSYPSADDPNRWDFSVYNNTANTGECNVTAHFLCVKQL